MFVSSSVTRIFSPCSPLISLTPGPIYLSALTSSSLSLYYSNGPGLVCVETVNWGDNTANMCVWNQTGDKIAVWLEKEIRFYRVMEGQGGMFGFEKAKWHTDVTMEVVLPPVTKIEVYQVVKVEVIQGKSVCMCSNDVSVLLACNDVFYSIQWNEPILKEWKLDLAMGDFVLNMDFNMKLAILTNLGYLLLSSNAYSTEKPAMISKIKLEGAKFMRIQKNIVIVSSERCLWFYSLRDMSLISEFKTVSPGIFIVSSIYLWKVKSLFWCGDFACVSYDCGFSLVSIHGIETYKNPQPVGSISWYASSLVFVESTYLCKLPVLIQQDCQALLLGSEHLWIYKEPIPNLESFNWHVVKYPTHYLEQFPMRLCVADSIRENFAVCGKHGFVLKFGNINHERKIKVINFCWFQTVIFVAHEMTTSLEKQRSYQLDCFPKTHLDLNAVVGSLKLKGYPKSMHIMGEKLLVGFNDFSFEIYEVDFGNNKIIFRLLSSFFLLPYPDDDIEHLEIRSIIPLQTNFVVLFSNSELWFFNIESSSCNKLLSNNIHSIWTCPGYLPQGVKEAPLPVFMTRGINGMQIWFAQNIQEGTFASEFLHSLDSLIYPLGFNGWNIVLIHFSEGSSNLINSSHSIIPFWLRYLVTSNLQSVAESYITSSLKNYRSSEDQICVDLEQLLVSVVDDDLILGQKDRLPIITCFLAIFREVFPVIFVNCVRCTDSIRWFRFFGLVDLIVLLNDCLQSGNIDCAAKYLLVIAASMPEQARKLSLCVLKSAINQGNSVLAAEVFRFWKFSGSSENSSVETSFTERIEKLLGVII